MVTAEELVVSGTSAGRLRLTGTQIYSARCRDSLWLAYRSVIGYLNTVGLRGNDIFVCPLVKQRRAAVNCRLFACSSPVG